MNAKNITTMCIIFIILFVIGTIVVFKLSPKMHPTVLIERLIIKTQKAE
jgi:hypothetical protein